jgi:hypothetical protein
MRLPRDISGQDLTQALAIECPGGPLAGVHQRAA